jgi:hypothetical protein
MYRHPADHPPCGHAAVTWSGDLTVRLARGTTARGLVEFPRAAQSEGSPRREVLAVLTERRRVSPELMETDFYELTHTFRRVGLTNIIAGCRAGRRPCGGPLPFTFATFSKCVFAVAVPPAESAWRGNE